jgi:hypothetical protein
MSRFNAELRLQTEAEDKESGQVVDPYEERKEKWPFTASKPNGRH